MAESTARIPVDHCQTIRGNNGPRATQRMILWNINYVLCWRAKFQTQMKRGSHDLFQSML